MLNLTLFAIAALTVLSVPKTVDAPRQHGKLVVVNQHDHSVTVVDLSKGITLGTVSVGVNGHELEVSRDGKLAYVPIYSNVGVGSAGTNGDHVDIVDLQKFELVGHIPMGGAVRPHCAKLGHDGLLYVSAELDHALYGVDLKTNEVVSKIPSGQDETHMFVITKSGHAYTSNISSGSVSVLNLKTKTLEKIIPIGKTIQRISLSPDEKTVYVHDQTVPVIWAIDTKTNSISDHFALTGEAFASAPTLDGKHLLALCANAKLVEVIDLKSKTIIKTFPLPSSSQEICLSPDGAFAYVSCIGNGFISVIDLKNWEMLAPIVLTPGVDGVAWVK